MLGMLLQRFDFVDHLNYQLKTKTTLTVKPDELPHPGAAARDGLGTPAAPDAAPRSARAAWRGGRPAIAPAPRRPGTAPRCRCCSARTSARPSPSPTRLAQEGTERGFDRDPGALDDHVDDLPADGAACSSCARPTTAPRRTTPPRSAGGSRDRRPRRLRGGSYTVFGCGNTEWAATYQAVPTLLDDAAGGARRRAGSTPRGEGNAAADFDAAYRAWHDGALGDLAAALDLPAEVAAGRPRPAPRLSITLTNRQLTNPVIVSYQAPPGAGAGEPRADPAGDKGEARPRSTRHIEIALPAGTSYRAGDHLGVLPRNSVDLIRRVMARFGLDAGQYLTIIPNSGTHTHLPIDEPAPLLGRARQLRRAAGRREPRRHRGPRPLHRRRRATGGAGGPGQG